MLTTFITTMVVLIASAILGFWMSNKFDWGWKHGMGVILGLMGTIGGVLFFILAGMTGEGGFKTYTETPTTQFTKAMAADHSSVTIVYGGKPYLYEQYNVVNNFDSITNILICEGRSVIGAQTKWDIKIVTSPNQLPTH